MSTQVSARLDPAIFRLPVDRIRAGYYSDALLRPHQDAARGRGRAPARDTAGVPKARLGARRDRRAIAILKTCAGRAQDGAWIPGWDQLEVHGLREGDRIAPRETVLTIQGDYTLFAHLETVYLGVLARRSLIMRNVSEVVQAAGGKQIFYFPARHDHWLVQTGDGWSAHVAGAIGVSTEAQASWWGGRGIGTVPHGLIAAYGGDTVKAAVKFAEHFHSEMNITVLVDSRMTRSRPRWRSRTRSGESCGACASTPPSSSLTARCRKRSTRTRAASPHRRQPSPGREGPRRARRCRLPGRADRRLGRLQRDPDQGVRKPRAWRSTPTASAPR